MGGFLAHLMNLKFNKIVNLQQALKTYFHQTFSRTCSFSATFKKSNNGYSVYKWNVSRIWTNAALAINNQAWKNTVHETIIENV